jgi:hypothetical protein
MIFCRVTSLYLPQLKLGNYSERVFIVKSKKKPGFRGKNRAPPLQNGSPRNAVFGKQVNRYKPDGKRHTHV